MNSWKKWTICLVMIVMSAIFLQACGTEPALPETEIGSGQAHSEAREPDSQRDHTILLASLLGVSVLGNVLSVIYICKKNGERKTKQIDDVPLVEYDIDNDIF